MFEQEFEKALHLEEYTFNRLKDSFENETKRCENANDDNGLGEIKSYSLIEIATMTRDLYAMEEEVKLKLKDIDSSEFKAIIREDNSMEILTTLEKDYFNSNFSKQYLCKFTKTVLHYIFMEYREDALLHFRKYFENLSIIEKPLALRVAEILSIDISSHNLHSNFIRYEVKKTTEELVLKKLYIIDDIETLRLIIEMTALYLIIDKQEMQDPFITASFYVYRIIALELYQHDRASEGIVFAKEGLFVQSISDKAKAISVLCMCAIGAYGKLQLAYDTYFSWIYNIAVGEFADLYREHDVKTVLPNQAELSKWWKDKRNAEEVATIYNNIAYVCGTISETYDKRDERRRVFLDYAFIYINNAIGCFHEPSFYLGRSIIQYRIALLNELPDRIENNRMSSSLSSAREHLTKTVDNGKKIVSNDKIEIFEAQSNYAEFLLDWLLEAFQIYVQNNQAELQTEDSITKHLILFRTYYRNKDFAKNINAFFKIFFKMKETFAQKTDSTKKAKSQSEILEKNKWEAYFSLCDFSFDNEGNDNNLKEWLLLLMLLNHSSNTLKTQLKRQDYTSTNYFLRISELDKDIKKTRDKTCPIAYYTTLSNIKFLFDAMTETQALGSADEIIKTKKTNAEKQECEIASEESKENKKNCLTLMHVRHMNDPLEGLMLLRILFQDMEETLSSKRHPLFSKQTPESYREQIYDQNYVFLKAFTERLDKLDMWNRYASDRASGKDSNGCCVQLNPETFIRQDKDTEQRMKKQFNMQDDFKLYKVLYLSDKGEVAGQEDTNVLLYYETFKMLFVTLNEFLCDQELSQKYGNNWDEFAAKIAQITEKIIMNIMFLFKPEDYSGEKESRIVIIRTSDQKSSFHLTSTSIPRVYITPFHQVYVDKITVGPKTESPDHWLPYLQYKIDGMRQVIQEDFDEGTRISYFPEKISVRKSTIPYQD